MLTTPDLQSPPSPHTLQRRAGIDAALQVLVVLNLVQVAAGFLDADPSPPDAVQPLIAATAAVGVAALALVRSALPIGYLLGIGFALVSMIGMGPHKLFLANGGVIAPVALVGFAAELVVIIGGVRQLRSLS